MESRGAGNDDSETASRPLPPPLERFEFNILTLCRRQSAFSVLVFMSTAGVCSSYSSKTNLKEIDSLRQRQSR